MGTSPSTAPGRGSSEDGAAMRASELPSTSPTINPWWMMTTKAWRPVSVLARVIRAPQNVPRSLRCLSEVQSAQSNRGPYSHFLFLAPTWAFIPCDIGLNEKTRSFQTVFCYRIAQVGLKLKSFLSPSGGRECKPVALCPSRNHCESDIGGQEGENTKQLLSQTYFGKYRGVLKVYFLSLLFIMQFSFKK